MARDGLLPLGPAVRGGGLRRPGRQRLVGRAGRFFTPGSEILVARRRRRRAAPPWTSPTPSWHRSRRRARERTLAEHTADQRAAELRACSEMRGLPAGRAAGERRAGGSSRCGASSRPPAAGSRIQPLAFSKELLPVGQPARRTARAAPRGQRVPGRAHDAPAGADKHLLRHLAGQVATSSQYYGGGVGRRADRATSSSRGRPGCATRSSARCRWSTARRAGRRRPAGHDLVPGGRPGALPDDAALVPALPGRPARALRRGRRPTRTARVREIQVKRQDAALALGLGRFKMPGRVLHELHALWRSRDRARRVHRHAGQRLPGRRAARRVGVRAGERLRRRRHAPRLPRGARAAAAAAGHGARPTAPRRCGGADQERERR